MRITDLTRRQGDFLLKIDNAYFEPGKIHGMIGSNGSGKSTLAKLIMGIIPADSGCIDYEGLTPRDITMTGQKPYLLHSSVYQNLIYPLKIRGIEPRAELVDQWLEKAGLQHKRKQYALSLSSGEQQRLSFARALIFGPKLVIVDETLSNLAPDGVRLFESIMEQQQRENPITWITISHQLVHISKLCDVVHFMEQGRLVQSGTPEQVLKHPTNPSVIQYLANTEVSFKG